MRDIFSIERENILGQKRKKQKWGNTPVWKGKGKKRAKTPVQHKRIDLFDFGDDGLLKKKRKKKKRKEKETCSAKKESTLSISAMMDFLNSRSFVSGAPYIYSAYKYIIYTCILGCVNHIYFLEVCVGMSGMYLHIHMSVHVRVYVLRLYIYTHIYIYIYIYKHIHIYILVYIHVHIYICIVYIYIAYACTHIYIYNIYIMCAYTCMCMCIYTLTTSCFSKFFNSL